jgi:hypothetical protein
MSRFGYRLDTNFAKMDRIEHAGIEQFKQRVLLTELAGLTVREWSRVLCSEEELQIRSILSDRLGISDENADELVK